MHTAADLYPGGNFIAPAGVAGIAAEGFQNPSAEKDKDKDKKKDKDESESKDSDADDTDNTSDDEAAAERVPGRVKGAPAE